MIIVKDKPLITIDDFAKMEIRVGRVVKAENVEKSNKLIRLTVVFNPDSAKATSGEARTIFTGVRGFGYVPEDFLDKQFLFVVNLEPKAIMGEESQGMILAVDGEDNKPHFIAADGLDVGAKVR